MKHSALACIYLQGYLGPLFLVKSCRASLSGLRDYCRAGGKLATRSILSLVIDAGLTEEDKAPLRAGRMSTVLNNERAIFSVSSKQTDPRVTHSSKFCSSYFRKISVGVKICTMQKFAAIR